MTGDDIKPILTENDIRTAMAIQFQLVFNSVLKGFISVINERNMGAADVAYSANSALVLAIREITTNNVNTVLTQAEREMFTTARAAAMLGYDHAVSLFLTPEGLNRIISIDAPDPD